MSKVTSKLQLSIPKALADQLGLRPGDEVRWVAEGRSLRLLPERTSKRTLTVAERLALFDAATERQRGRQRRRKLDAAPASRGWTREELYGRGGSR